MTLLSEKMSLCEHNIDPRMKYNFCTECGENLFKAHNTLVNALCFKLYLTLSGSTTIFTLLNNDKIFLHGLKNSNIKITIKLIDFKINKYIVQNTRKTHTHTHTKKNSTVLL
jgi:hypothetical protein